jgi:lysophospholipase L1-like esterase
MPLVPTSPPSLALHAGDVLLHFDPPETHEFQSLSKDGAPPPAIADYQPSFASQDTWPGALRLTPDYDTTRTHILGNFFRSFRPETLHVTSLDGARVYQRDVDFVYHEDAGLIANKDGRMKGRVVARAKAALQRLDLVQRDTAGRPSVKKGASAWLCPVLPEPDPGCTAVAGIYLAPWRAARNPHYDQDPGLLAGASGYAITAREIFLIQPAAPAATLFPENLATTRAKLHSGHPLKIAFLGDSITLGAEATRWWEDRYDEHSTPWKGRLVHALRTRFPASTLSVIEAWRGGTPVAYGLEKLPWVLAQQPDLVIVAFGANDADGPAGGAPRTSVAAFGEALATLAARSRAAGAEVLFVTPFPLHPWLRNGAAQRLADDYIPVLKRTAAREGAAVADVHTDYVNLNTRGIPYWSQNHNWTNHPGDFGHRVYADTLLRCLAPDPQ